MARPALVREEGGDERRDGLGLEVELSERVDLGEGREGFDGERVEEEGVEVRESAECLRSGESDEDRAPVAVDLQVSAPLREGVSGVR